MNQRKLIHCLLIFSLLFGTVSCATMTGPKVTKGELEEARGEFNARFFEASQTWLPRVYRVGYHLLHSSPPEYGERKPSFNFMGVGTGELKKPSRKYYEIPDSIKGVLVLGIYPGSKAENLDIKQGDVVLTVNEKKVHSLGSYLSRIRKAEKNQVTLELWRKGKTFKVEVPIEKVYYNANFFLAPTPEFDANSLFSKINVGIGAIRYSQNDDELAFIMGHELAHTARKHSLKQMGSGMGTAVAYGVLAGVVDVFTVPGLGSLVTQPIHAATDAAISRDYEREADYFGMLHAFHSGFNVENGGKVMARLGSDAPGFEVFAHTFASHPDFSERALRLEKVTDELKTKYPNQFPQKESPDWEIHVPIKKGETLETAVGRLLEEKQKESEKMANEESAKHSSIPESSQVKVAVSKSGIKEKESTVSSESKLPSNLETNQTVQSLKTDLNLGTELSKEPVKTEVEVLGRDELIKKLGIQTMGLTRNTASSPLPASEEGAANRFSIQDGKAIWFCRFSKGALSNGASFPHEAKLTVTWYGPRGQILREDSFLAFPGTSDFSESIFRFDQFPELELTGGALHVRVGSNGVLLDERSFEILSA